MPKVATRVAALFALLAFAQLSGAGEIERQTARLPDVDAPPRGSAQWVARSMRMNGVPMTIKQFTTVLSVDEVFNFYESWQRGRSLATLQRQVLDGWQLLSVNTGDYHISIRVRASRQGSEGTITV